MGEKSKSKSKMNMRKMKQDMINITLHIFLSTILLLPLVFKLQ